MLQGNKCYKVTIVTELKTNTHKAHENTVKSRAYDKRLSQTERLEAEVTLARQLNLLHI